MINRGGPQQVPLVIIPGWGFTGQVFNDHAAFKDETLIVPTGFTSPEMVGGLSEFLADQQIGQIRILGWSMGGHIGVDFTMHHPEMVSSLTLVAVRQRWLAGDIDFTRQGLLDATGVSMGKFYRKCFLGAKADYNQFATLLMSYPQNYEVDFLDQGLTYLAAHRMPESLPLPVHLVQGDRDVVCPVAEMVNFPASRITMLAGVGHFPFSHADFRL